jgi:hypothetical protein
MSTLALLPALQKRFASRASKAAPTPRPGLRVRVVDKTILHLEGEPIWDAARPVRRRNLIDLLFTLPNLNALTLDSARGKAVLQFSRPIGSTAETLEKVAGAMRQRNPKRLPLAHEEVLLHEANLEPVKITRHGGFLTFWQIKEYSHAHFRLRHPMLHLPLVREQVLQELGTLPEVVWSTHSYFLWGAIHVLMHPQRLDHTHLIRELDEAITATSEFRGHEVNVNESVLIHTNLVLAPISDFVFPPLGILNVLMVWSLNIHHAPHAWEALKRGRTNMHLLYLCIGTLTILTFSFIGAAVMYWLLLFWPRQVRYLRRTYEGNFLTTYRRAPRRTWVEKNGALIETPVQELADHSVVVLKPGDIIPGDGVVLGGGGRIGERFITGALEPVQKAKGDTLYATTRVIEGELSMRVDAIRKDTVAEKISAWFREALEKTRTEQTVHAQDFAEKAVLPTLLVGGFALTTGGMHMTKAILRPDYLTGPRVAENLVELAMMIQNARDGILLPNMDCLEKLVACDCVVFDDSVAWRGTHLEEYTFAEKLHERGLPEVILLSEKDPTGVARYGFDSVHIGYNTEAKRAYIARRQSFDHVVVYVGDCRSQKAAADQADFAISVFETPTVLPTGLQASILGPDLIKIVRLLTLAQESLREFKTSYGITMVPNIAAALAAYYFHTSVNTSVLLTNLGTAVNYFRYRSILTSQNAFRHADL